MHLSLHLYIAAIHVLIVLCFSLLQFLTGRNFMEPFSGNFENPSVQCAKQNKYSIVKESYCEKSCHLVFQSAARAGHMLETDEPRHEKTNVLHVRKQRRRSTSQ